MASQGNDERLEAIALAASVLSQRVGTLTDVVAISNREIDRLRKEVAQKPDDIELQTVASISTVERHQQLKYGIITAILASVLSGTISTAVAVDYAGDAYDERTKAAHTACLRNNERARVVKDSFDRAARGTTGDMRANFIAAAGQLRGLNADCNTLHPLPKE